MTADAQPLQLWLNQQPRTVRELLSRAGHLAAINHELQQQWASEPWVQSIRIANIRGNTVVIFAQTAAALVPLRYRKEALLSLLKERFQLACKEIEAKVRPEF
jgi:hypothetical protein